MRTRKTVTENGVTTATDYALHGKLITHLTQGANNLHFFYDAQSRPAKVEFNDTLYTYLHNLQGDIVGIVDSEGALVVEYKYDAWGKPISTWTLTAEYQALAVCNPFRYRGYVYDGETGLYYLRSRYYNSETSRWINVDSLLNQESILGNNIFVYCLNDPIDMADETGNLPFLAVTAAIGAVVGAVVGGVVAAKSGGNVWAGIGIGAAAGALIGTGAGASAGAALAGSITATTAAVMAGGGALVGTVATGGLGAGATYIANNFQQAVTGSGGQVVSNTVNTGKNIYYQVTSSQAAKTIAATGKLIPSSGEGSVCVLNFQPTIVQAQQIGAKSYETVIRFTTNCSTFVPDTTVPYVGAFRNIRDGAITVINVFEVGFK